MTASEQTRVTNALAMAIEYLTKFSASVLGQKVASELRAAIAIASYAPDYYGLLHAAKHALEEMRHTVAPRNSFTDAVDELDAAITKAEGR